MGIKTVAIHSDVDASSVSSFYLFLFSLNKELVLGLGEQKLNLFYFFLACRRYVQFLKTILTVHCCTR
jgi:hypothetical protein